MTAAPRKYLSDQPTSQIVKTTKIVLVLFAISACVVAALGAWLLPPIRFTIATSEYPHLLAACQQAPTAEREKMIRVVDGAASKTTIFNFTLSERNEFLRVGGYCVGNWFESGCKRLPIGTEAEGIAIDIFGNSACHYPQPAPTKCIGGERNFRC